MSDIAISGVKLFSYSYRFFFTQTWIAIKIDRKKSIYKNGNISMQIKK